MNELPNTLQPCVVALRNRLQSVSNADLRDDVIIAQCAGNGEVSHFFEQHTLELYQFWTEKYCRPIRVEALYQLTAALLVGTLTTGTPEQVAVDYCFSLFLSQVLQDSQAGMHLLNTMLQPKASSFTLVDDFNRTGYLRLTALEIRKKGEAAIVSFIDGDTLHAEDGDFVRDLESAADIVYLSKQIKTGVLRGGIVNHPKYAGRRVFCSGINLKKLHASGISYPDFLIGREMGCINKLVHGVAYSPNESNARITKPWIAVVDTFAIGGGMQMVLACDYVIGEQGCYVSLPAAKEGIIPGVSNLRLTTATSERFAKQVILHGRKVMADDADAGFIFDLVVASEELDQVLEQAIALMAAPAVPANKRMLVLAKEPLSEFRTYMQAFCREQVVRMYALDVKEKTGKFSHKTPRAIIS
ncbi:MULTISPECIES: enoyl-CoA hydratase/isomerase family protein [unclassified Serratia (in: enterobacteria)]|uniref:enoyl-CoA hydratase/isomerase family protein n=1 Tax=unclassified Serratia (in: enterobacteria) TaxID=2647522 RepID=UPI0015F6538B|nr:MULTISPECIES: enoyl-CoA hydratase/isomerase family protein [unclassified Serratia (in: enterobacteria)]